jgi:hypothetical protein
MPNRPIIPRNVDLPGLARLMIFVFFAVGIYFVYRGREDGSRGDLAIGCLLIFAGCYYTWAWFKAKARDDASAQPCSEKRSIRRRRQRERDDGG